MIRSTHAAAAGSDGALYAIGRDGSLVYYRHLGWASGSSSFAKRTQTRLARGRGPGTGWDSLFLVLAGGDGALYAVKADGSLVYYRHLGWADGSAKFLRRGETVLAKGSGPGSGWDSYEHVFAGRDGALYAVKTDGSLVYYRHTGWKTGTTNFAKSTETVLAKGQGPGSGWASYRHVLAGSDGALYAVKTDGSLVYYRHTGWKTGSVSFAKWSETVLSKGSGPGSAWDSFVHVFAGDDGALYGIKEDGSLVYYRHTGWATGSTTFAKTTETVLTAGSGPGTAWGAFDRAARLGSIDGAPVSRLGSNVRVAGNRTNFRAVSEGATTTGRQRRRRELRVFFQNMQLFPNKIGDILSSEEQALAQLLAAGADAGLAGAAIGLAGALGPPGWFAAGWLANEIKDSGTLSEGLAKLLDTALYKGAGREVQLLALIAHLRQQKYDIVGLCEMWVPSETKRLLNELSDIYPYAAVGPVHGPDYLPSGLVLLSRGRITGADGIVFRSSIGEDGLASKGVLWARIRNECDVFVTHLNSDNPKTPEIAFGPGRTVLAKQRLQAEAVRTFMLGCRDPRYPALLMGDFNLDAAGGKYSAKVDDLVKLRAQRTAVRAMAADPNGGRSMILPFAETRAPTNRLEYYTKNLPARPPQMTEAEWRRMIGMDTGEQIDLFVLSQGTHRRWETRPVERVEIIAQHGAARRQLSDHIGILLRVRRQQDLTVAPSRPPSSVTAEIDAFHCYLETSPRNASDDARMRLTLRSDGESVSMLSPERAGRRFRLHRYKSGEVRTRLDSIGETVEVQVQPREEDWPSSTDTLQTVSVELPAGGLLRPTDGNQHQSSWATPVSRGHGGEYAARLTVTADWS